MFCEDVPLLELLPLPPPRRVSSEALPAESKVAVKPINVYEFIEFGMGIQGIRWFASHFDGDQRRNYAKAKGRQLEWFRDRWLVSRNVGIDLINEAITYLKNAVELDELDGPHGSLARLGQSSVLQGPRVDWDYQTRAAGRALNELMTILEHECPKLPVFMVLPVRAFDTTILMESAERALSETSQKRLSEHWREGWREAGKCLAFDAPTAATYQMLRVTEGVIKKYRKLVTGIAATDADGLSEHINALKKSGVSESVITGLRSLKNAHRNPKMHPGKNVTLDEAIGLFGLCTSVIDFITADMETRERAKGTIADDEAATA